MQEVAGQAFLGDGEVPTLSGFNYREINWEFSDQHDEGTEASCC